MKGKNYYSDGTYRKSKISYKLSEKNQFIKAEGYKR